MVVVVCPNVPLASVEKREKFLSLLKTVAGETKEKEQECLSYFWLRHDPRDVDLAQTDVYLRGLEVYTNDHSLAVVHRSGEKYNHMRQTVAAQSLITYPKHGIPLYTPAGVGFLSKSHEIEDITDDSLFTISDFNIETSEERLTVMKELEHLARDLEDDAEVLSFCTFCPQEPAPQTSIILLGRYTSEHSSHTTEMKLQGLERRFQDIGKIAVTTRWQGAGFGFIRRNP